jgi:integrase
LGTGDDELTFPKSKKSVRVIYLPDFLFLKVRSWICDNSLSGKNFLFFGRSHSEAVGINTVYRFLKSYQKKSGLPEFRFHSFRKSEASLLNDSGLSGEVIRDYLGHDSFETTKEYYLGDSDEKKEKIRDLLQSKLSKLFR